jgi:trigger factor
LTEQDKQAETMPSAPPDGDIAAAGAEAASAVAVSTEVAEPEAAVGVEAEPAKTEEKKELVAYELLDATSRAGSIVDVKFKVPYAEYDRKTQDFYKELRQTVIIEGFRRGKAPLKLIQNRYHKEVKQDTLDFLFGNSLEQIAADKGYGVLRQFDRVDPEVAEGQDMVFAVSLEIRPKIEPTGYDGFDLTVDAHEINEATVEAEIEKLRLRHATHQTAELLAWQEGLALSIDLQVADDKNAKIDEQKDFFLRHPEDILPQPVIEQLRGRRAGELVVARVPNERKSEGGVVVSESDHYTIKIVEVKREILPELNDAFAQDVGSFKTLQELRDRIRKELDTREERQVREQALDKMYGLLFDRNPFDIPPTLLNETARDLTRERLERLRRLGVGLDVLEEHVEDMVSRNVGDAERMIRLVILKGAIAEKEKIAATDEDVERAIARQAEAEDRRPLAIRARLEAQKAMERFRDDLKYDLVDDFLLKRANISKQMVMMESKLATPGGQ